MEPSVLLYLMGGSKAWLAANHLPAACQIQHGPFHTWDTLCQTLSEVCNTHYVDLNAQRVLISQSPQHVLEKPDEGVSVLKTVGGFLHQILPWLWVPYVCRTVVYIFFLCVISFILESGDTVNIPVARTNVSCASVLVRFRKNIIVWLKVPFCFGRYVHTYGCFDLMWKNSQFWSPEKKMQTSPAVLTNTAVSCLPAVLTWIIVICQLLLQMSTLEDFVLKRELPTLYPGIRSDK